MKLEELQENWNKFGETDPLWGILAWPDKDGNRWDIETFFATGIVEIDEVLAYVESVGLALQKGSACDFGCGVGRLSQALALRFERVVGVDISPKMIELAEHYNQNGDRCQYLLNEADDLSIFDDGTFDFIYSNITLQHMQPSYAKAYIVEFLRVLEPGGILVFQIPSRPVKRYRSILQPLKPTAAWRTYRKLRYGDQPVMEMYGVPKENVLKLLLEQGAEIVDVQADTQADTAWQSYRYCVVASG